METAAANRPALAAPISETLRHVPWMLAGVIAAFAAVVLAEGAATEPSWTAIGAGLLAAGAGLLAGSMAQGSERHRERLAAVGAGLLAAVGLAVGDVPAPAYAVPGLLVPLLLVARPFSAGLRVASVALLAVAGVGLQAAHPVLGASFAIVWLFVVAVAAIVWVFLPRQGPWRSMLLPGAAAVALFAAAL